MYSEESFTFVPPTTTCCLPKIHRCLAPPPQPNQKSPTQKNGKMESTAFDSSSPLPHSSFTPPSSSPPTSPSRESFTPPSTTRQRRTVLVKMGPCNWQGKIDSFRCS